VLFADGAGSNDVIASLPLAEGYTATYRNFDIMRQQVKPRQLRVVGSELFLPERSTRGKSR
jgi:hypothetical protein